MSKILAIIPARGGSKRIPRKNIKRFYGKPILSYSIAIALDCGCFDEIMVSTDDLEIADISKACGGAVPFLRSKKTSDDHAGLAEVCIEVLDSYKNLGLLFSHICCILPTAPLLKSEKILEAKDHVLSGRATSSFPVVKYSYPIQRSLKIENGYARMIWPDNYMKRSQDLEPSYHDSGQFYFMTTKALLEEQKVFTEKSYPILLTENEVQDIDDEADWKIAEMKYKWSLEG